jgi:uncharacterized membrane protein YqhA
MRMINKRIYKVFIISFKTFDRSQDINFLKFIEEQIYSTHLVKFIVLIVSILELSHFMNQYKGRGRSAYPPSMMLAKSIYLDFIKNQNKYKININKVIQPQA